MVQRKPPFCFYNKERIQSLRPPTSAKPAITAWGRGGYKARSDKSTLSSHLVPGAILLGGELVALNDLRNVTFHDSEHVLVPFAQPQVAPANTQRSEELNPRYDARATRTWPAGA